MPTTKKSSPPRKVTTKVTKKKSVSPKKVTLSDIGKRLVKMRLIAKVIAGSQNLLRRRPHRSFRRTYRRDYVRSLDIPGYWAFTNYVRKTLWDNRKIFACVLLIYAVIIVAVVNLASEAIYSELRMTINETGTEVFSGAWGEIGKAALLLSAGVTGAYNEAPTGSQSESQIYLVIIGLLTWLTTVWLLRAILAGRRPKMRDGLYNAGAPIVPTFFITAVIVIQLLPVALAIYGYNSAVASGLLEGGVEAMVFWSVAALLMLLSLYWLTSTLIALVVVTLPGMYPMQALRTAGDLVIGRRVRILMRVLWMAMVVVVVWLLIAIPLILFDGWLKGVMPSISWMPIIPLMLLVMGTLTVVWVASYIYLLYRKIVDDDTLPA